MLAAPEELDIPSRLVGAAWPYDNHWYASQLPGEPLLSASSDDSHAYVEGLFSDVCQPSPWPDEFPPLSSLVEDLPPVLAVAPQFGTSVTRVEVTVHKVKVVAILDTGSPVNVISSRLARKIKMAPDLDHAVVYGTAGTASTKSIGAYLALPLRFGKLVLTAPAVVLENEGYDLLIGTQFLKEFDGIVNHQEGFVSLLGYRVPLASDIAPVTKGLQKRRTCLLEYPTHILSLDYNVTQAKVHLPPLAVLGDEGMPVYPLERVMIPAKSQILLATGIWLTIPKGHLATISSIENPSPREPLVCPGVLDPAYSDELTLLVGNLTDSPLAVNPKLPIAYVHLLAADDLVGYGPCGLMRDLGLPDPYIGAVLPALDADLPPTNHAKALALIEEYADLFSSGPHDFGLLKGTSHRLDLEDNRPF